jgi:hypothetical protein
MLSQPKAKRWGTSAVEIKPIGDRKLGRITVGSGQDQQYLLARPYGQVPESNVRNGEASRILNWRIESHHFPHKWSEWRVLCLQPAMQRVVVCEQTNGVTN